MGKGRVPKNEGGSIRAQRQGGWPETHHINHEQEPVLQNRMPTISLGVPDVTWENAGFPKKRWWTTLFISSYFAAE